MKLIIAIVRPIMLDKVIVSLEEIENFPGVTVSEAEGFGHRLRTTSTELLSPFKEKKRIEIVSNDESFEAIVTALRRSAHTGKKGDGIIWLVPVKESVLI